MAADLYLKVKAEGWEAALKILTGQRGKKLRATESQAEDPATAEAQTIGWFLRQAALVLTPKVRPATLQAYSSAFRCIAREAALKKKISCKLAEARPLSDITTESVQTWMDVRFKKHADQNSDLLSLNRKKRTINALLRNAAALFAAETLVQISNRTNTPLLVNPFAGVKRYPVLQTKYSSKFDIPHILGAARARFRRGVAEENGDAAAAWMIFVLALYAGLRGNEIDKLMWTQVNLEGRVISIHTTHCFTAKTTSSNAEVPIEAEVAEELRWYRNQFDGKPEFVICPGTPVPTDTTGPERRRLNAPFTLLCDWMRNYEANGVKPLADTQKPIHELRKEAGSVVMRNGDIYKASLFLRHSDIQTTVRHYADTRSKTTVGLGSLLTAV